MKELEIYVHIPFCVKKCAYCDFFSGPYPEDMQQAYFRMMEDEISETATRPDLADHEVRSVFFGGGTPSAVGAESIGRILACLREKFRIRVDAEISMECNPGTLTAEKLEKYKRYGVNRLSIGLQSTEERLLKTLGRIHTFREFQESYLLAREAGFTNINIDLMSGLPEQTVEDYKKTLEKVLALSPEHISAYSLIIEEGTPFYKLYGEDGEKRSLLPGEDADREMYRLTKEMLAEKGYTRYEISNYAKSGYECLHNLGYWSGTPYLGFGAGAASYFEEKRYKHAECLGYRDVPDIETETLSGEDLMSEFMILGLRKMQGVSDTDFRERFEASFFEKYKDVIRKYTETGFLIREGMNLRFSDAGIDVSNVILAEFL